MCLLMICFISSADIDDCINHTCNNGGSCEDGLNSYYCNCPLGFTGNYCETGIPQQLSLAISGLRIYSIVRLNLYIKEVELLSVTP